MRNTALIALLLALAVPATAQAGKPERGPAGSLTVEGGRAAFTIKGKGLLLGRIERGAVLIVDLTPKDRWPVAVNGQTRPRRISYRGQNITFRVLGGEYRIEIRGEGVSISSRGWGVAMLDGEPDAFGDAGVFATGDGVDCSDATLCEPIPDLPRRVAFPEAEEPSPTQQRQGPRSVDAQHLTRSVIRTES